MLTIKVRYFAMLREQKGCAEEPIQCASGTTVSELYLQLFPEKGPEQIRVGFAVNLNQVGSDTVLEEGDEVAFLPPLGGG